MTKDNIKKAIDAEEADYRNKALSLEIVEAIEAICLRHKYDLKAMQVNLVDSGNTVSRAFKMNEAKKGHIFSLYDSLDQSCHFLEQQIANWEQLYNKPKDGGS